MCFEAVRVRRLVVHQRRECELGNDVGLYIFGKPEEVGPIIGTGTGQPDGEGQPASLAALYIPAAHVIDTSMQPDYSERMELGVKLRVGSRGLLCWQVGAAQLS